MVSDIELEIAITVIQLTAVSLPVLLGIARYYFKNNDELDTILEKHPELPSDTSPEDFVLGVFLIAGLALLFAYLSSSVLINQLNNLYLVFAVNGYGVFLITVLFMIPIGLGFEVKAVIYRLFAFGLSILGLPILAAALLFFSEGQIGFGLGSFVFSLFFLIPAFFIFRAAKRVEPDTEGEGEGEGEGDDPATPAAAERERDYVVELDSSDP